MVLGQRPGSQCSLSGGGVGAMAASVDQRIGLNPLGYYTDDNDRVMIHSLPWSILSTFR